MRCSSKEPTLPGIRQPLQGERIDPARVLLPLAGLGASAADNFNKKPLCVSFTVVRFFYSRRDAETLRKP